MVGFFQRLRRSRQHDKQTEVGVNSKPSCGQVDQQTLLKLHKQLGDGPMRFAPFKPERRIEEQISCLTPKERSSFREIKSKWNEKHADQSERQFGDETCLRVARVHAVAGRGWEVKSALKTLKYYNEHHLQELTAAKLECELWSQKIFPVPNLRTKDGNEVVYMRPSRFEGAAFENAIPTIAYVLGTLVERQQPSEDGISLVVCMNSWTKENFSVESWFKLLVTLQRKKLPVRVNLILLVNAPNWFEAFLDNGLKKKLDASFAKNIRIVEETKLNAYLRYGFQKFLPDDMITGQASTRWMVDDFCQYRKAVECAQGFTPVAKAPRRMSLPRMFKMIPGGAASGGGTARTKCSPSGGKGRVPIVAPHVANRRGCKVDNEHNSLLKSFAAAGGEGGGGAPHRARRFSMNNVVLPRRFSMTSPSLSSNKPTARRGSANNYSMMLED